MTEYHQNEKGSKTHLKIYLERICCVVSAVIHITEVFSSWKKIVFLAHYVIENAQKYENTQKYSSTLYEMYNNNMTPSPTLDNEVILLVSLFILLEDIPDKQFPIGLTLAWFCRQFGPIRSCHQYQYWLDSGPYASCSEVPLRFYWWPHLGDVILPENGLDASKFSQRNKSLVLIK